RVPLGPSAVANERGRVPSVAPPTMGASLGQPVDEEDRRRASFGSSWPPLSGETRSGLGLPLQNRLWRAWDGRWNAGPCVNGAPRDGTGRALRIVAIAPRERRGSSSVSAAFD